MISAPDFRRLGHYKMMAGVCLSVRLSVCRVPRSNSRTDRPMKPKIGRMEAITRVTREPVEIKRVTGSQNV